MDRKELLDAEDAAIVKLQAQARTAGAGAIAGSTLAVSRRALSLAQKAGKDDDARELRKIRSDSGVQTAIAKDLKRFRAYLDDAILDWMGAGWLMQAQWLADDMSSKRLRVKVRFTAKDRAGLAAYPIIGHLPSEDRDRLVAVLQYEFAGALGLCLRTTGSDAVIAQLGAVQVANGSRLAQECRQAFLSGVGAARKGFSDALTGKA